MLGDDEADIHPAAGGEVEGRGEHLVGDEVGGDDQDPSRAANRMERSVS